MVSTTVPLPHRSVPACDSPLLMAGVKHNLLKAGRIRTFSHSPTHGFTYLRLLHRMDGK